MIQIAPLGQTTNLFPAICDWKIASRKRFSAEGVTLIVPSYPEDKTIRWLMDRGMSMSKAYKTAGCEVLLPEQGLRACVSAVLRTKYYDTKEQRWKISAGNWTCIAFGKCFADYLTAKRTFEKKRGRIKVGEGVYAPSPAEEECIIRHYTISKNLAQAYATCNARDIIPAWPGAMESISGALNRQTGASMYEIIDTLYKLSSLVKPEDEVEPPTPEPEKPGDGLGKKSPYVLGIGLALLVFLMTR